jgi:hypothetical protein
MSNEIMLDKLIKKSNILSYNSEYQELIELFGEYNTTTDIVATEAIVEKIKVSINTLIDKFAKTYRSITKNIYKDIDNFVDDYKKAKELWNKRVMNNLENIDDETFGEIEIVPPVFSYSDSKATVKYVVSLLQIKDILPSIMDKTKGLETKDMRAIIDTMKQLNVDITRDNRTNSGYYIDTSRIYENTVHNYTTSELGYTKANLKASFKELDNIYSKLDFRHVKKLNQQIRQAFDELENKIQTIYKDKDKSKDQLIDQITLQLCRVYFYLNILSEVYNNVGWIPHLNFVCVLSGIEDYLLKKKD